MSAARVDHAASARTILSHIKPDELGGVDAADWLATAQVHATLALVEQQRVANLLLLIKPENPREFDTWDEISEALRLQP